MSFRVRDICGAKIEGPIAKGTRNAVTWRRRCRATPMRDRAELVGFVPGRCFQHQPSEVRNAVYREKALQRRADLDTPAGTG